jgi:ribosomal-protein-alanine N-acetyltransferase
MPEVMQIESSHKETLWTENDLIKVLRERNVIGMVVEENEAIIGFVVYELQKTSINILNLAVHPDHRRRKVGTAIMKKLKAKLTHNRRQYLTYDVRESNLDAHLFLKSQGLSAHKVARKYFRDYAGSNDALINEEDAYCFRYTEIEAAAKDEETELCGK